ncbi:HEPN domain-containing protein [Brevibacillus sp. Leaf182]|uniref:HEPN domain-containing protein n=1 Tax=Brevibacillus sp. Leaf182 TaxID=1736290 RepID=UPI0006F9FDBF|nr:HEPN domain-containing protein [Brevibacillus sp. Leaf182]RAT99184.1 hypothetical protein ASG16_005720 [Brevibacillus sp. Leaf182]
MISINQKVEVILPIFLSIPFDKEFDEIINQVIDELVSTTFLFPLDAEQLETNEVKVKFKMLNENDRRTSLLHTSSVRKRIFISAYTDLQIIDKPIEEIDEWNVPSIHLWSKVSVDYFIKRIYDFIISINIARVGYVQVDQGLIFIEDQLYDRTEMMISDFYEVLLFTKNTKWPVLENLEINTVWNWVTKKNGFLDGVGGTPVERALSALTYLFGSSGQSNQGMDLFFTMIALEALYCSSNNGIKEQLLEKSQVFLGAQSEYKKLFKSMYDYRSKFIHGGLNFPGKYHHFDASDDFEKFEKESTDVIFMAKSVLIATLQQLSKQNMDELKFKYTLVKN